LSFLLHWSGAPPVLRPFPTRRSSDLFAHAEHTLVAIDPAAGRVRGLAATVTVDGCPHLEQLAVDPAHGRRGIGSALLEEVCSRRSEEHTSELQSRFDLVCRLLLEKKK